MKKFGAHSRIKKPKPPRFISFKTPDYTPDWKKLFAGDQTLQAGLGGLRADSAADRASRNTNIFQKLLAYGAIPDLGALLGGPVAGSDPLREFGIDQNMANAIQNNPNSTVNTLARGHATNIGDLQDQLAARGVIRSGALHSGLNLEQQDYARRQADALHNDQNSGLLDFLNGFQQGFAGAERHRKNVEEPGLYSEARDRISQLPEGQFKAGVTVKATRVPGTNLYRDADGNYYHQDGSPAAKPAGPKAVGPHKPGQPPKRRPRRPSPPQRNRRRYVG